MGVRWTTLLDPRPEATEVRVFVLSLYFMLWKHAWCGTWNHTYDMAKADLHSKGAGPAKPHSEGA